MDDFQAHCVEAVRNFVQTAIIIDNEATLGSNGGVVVPKVAMRVGGSILSPVQPRLAVGFGALEEVQAHGTTEETGQTWAQVDGNDLGQPAEQELNVKGLTDAFSKLSVICGIFRPDAGATLVEAFTDAAQHADIVIVDWLLEGGTSLAAKEIVCRVLANDAKSSGRLRLIAVYTSQPDLAVLAQELLAEIRRVDTSVERLILDPNTRSLIGRNIRICFFNKTDSLGVPPQDIVSVEELPARLLVEFALLTAGVLSSYAVTSIATIRRATHSLLATFDKALDGVYVAHRCCLPHPDDANDFARELVISEISNLISMDQAVDACVSSPVLGLWIDHIAKAGRTFCTTDAEVSIPLLKRFVSLGVSELDKSAREQTKPDKSPGTVAKTKAVSAKNIAEIFYDSAAEALAKNKEFSRLTLFKREMRRAQRYPDNWAPTLTLGTVVKVMSIHPQTRDMADELPFEYLVCVQPRCDSVRLSGITSFPFQKAEYSEGKFNLVATNHTHVDERTDDAAFEEVTLRVSYKPRDIVMRMFQADDALGVVSGSKEASGGFHFKDKKGFIFLWVGDIKDLKAQRDASELAFGVHKVGVEDFEWLRRQSSGQ